MISRTSFKLFIRIAFIVDEDSFFFDALMCHFHVETLNVV